MPQVVRVLGVFLLLVVIFCESYNVRQRMFVWNYGGIGDVT